MNLLKNILELNRMKKWKGNRLYSFKEKMDYKDLDTLAILLNEKFKNNELKKIKE